MRLKVFLLSLMVGVPILFVLINWGVFGAHETFFFLVGSVSLSIGFVLLAVLGFAIAAVLLYVAMWRGRLLIDYRRQSKELEAQRVLADSAEASRFTELAVILRTELARQDVRFDTAFAALRTEVLDSTNSFAAVLGEMDDRLRRNREHSGPPGRGSAG